MGIVTQGKANIDGGLADINTTPMMLPMLASSGLPGCARPGPASLKVDCTNNANWWWPQQAGLPTATFLHLHKPELSHQVRGSNCFKVLLMYHLGRGWGFV